MGLHSRHPEHHCFHEYFPSAWRPRASLSWTVEWKVGASCGISPLSCYKGIQRRVYQATRLVRCSQARVILCSQRIWTFNTHIFIHDLHHHHHHQPWKTSSRFGPKSHGCMVLFSGHLEVFLSFKHLPGLLELHARLSADMQLFAH